MREGEGERGERGGVGVERERIGKREISSLARARVACVCSACVCVEVRARV